MIGGERRRSHESLQGASVDLENPMTMMMRGIFALLRNFNLTYLQKSLPMSRLRLPGSSCGEKSPLFFLPFPVQCGGGGRRPLVYFSWNCVNYRLLSAGRGERGDVRKRVETIKASQQQHTTTRFPMQTQSGHVAYAAQ